MKNILFILLVGILTACGKKESVSPFILEAESFLETNPEITYSLLNTIENPKQLSDRDYATWSLLMTQARDKMYLEYTSDSLINVAVQYFEQADEPDRLAWSYYYAGIISFEKNEFLSSQTAFLNAQAVAEKLSNPELLGRIYFNLANLYDLQGWQDSASVLYNKALRAYKRSTDFVGVGYSWHNMGRLYLTVDVDSAVRYYEQALPLFKNNPKQQASLLNSLGILYRQKGDYPQALSYIKQSLNVSGLNNTYLTPKLLNMGDIYRKMGERDSAVFLLKQCLSDPQTQTSANASLSVLYHDIGEYEKAYKYERRYSFLVDSVHKSKKATDLATELQRYEKENAIAQMQQRNLKIWLICGSIISFIVFLLMAYLLYLSKKSQAQALALLDANQLINTTKQNYEEVMDQKYSLEKNYKVVCKKLKQMEQQALVEKKQYSQLHELKRTLESQLSNNILFDLKRSPHTLSEQQWVELQITLDAICNHFTERLRTVHPNLTEDDIRYCTLFRLSFSAQEVATIMNVLKSSVSRKKLRIKERFTQEIFGENDFDDYISKF